MIHDFADGLTLERISREWAETEPDRLLCTFVDGGTRHTYGDLEREVGAFGAGLRAAGVEPGDRVAVCMANCFRYFVAMFGIHRAGAIHVPISPLYTDDEVGFVLQDSGARRLIVDDSTSALCERALALAPETALISNGEKLLHVATSFDALLDLGRDAPIAPTADSSSLALIMYTSGTTARPKGVLFNHGNLVHGSYNVANSFQWRADERLLHYFPLNHVNGGLIQLGPTLLRGASMVMVPKFSATQFASQLHDHDITFAAVNATHAKMILGQPESAVDADHPCRRMFLGMNLDEPRTREFERRFRTRFVTSYGLTEATGPCVISSFDHRGSPGIAGRVVPGYQVRVVAEPGRDAEVDEPGEILLRSTSPYGVTLGYWNNPEATAELFRDGWLHTGDIGVFDERGQLTFLERGKDMIKRSGFNVSPAEVERALLTDAAIDDVAVVGIPDDLRDEAIVAAVVVRADRDDEALLVACRQLLAEYKVPQHFLRMEVLPRDVLGKVDRKAIRRLAAETFL